jgi:hypothetical protein
MMVIEPGENPTRTLTWKPLACLRRMRRLSVEGMMIVSLFHYGQNGKFHCCRRLAEENEGQKGGQ